MTRRRGGVHRPIARLTPMVRLALTMTMACACATAAQADGYIVKARGDGNFQVDTNPLLQSKGAKTLIGWTSSPHLVVTGRTEAVTLDVDTQVDDSRFNEPAFDSTDVHNFSSLAYKGEKSFAKLEGGFDYDTTRTSEVGGTGRLETGVRHTGISFSPSFGYNLTPVQQISVTGNYNTALYSGNSDQFTDFQSFSLQPEYSYSFTLRDTGFVALQGSHFNTLNTKAKSSGQSVGPLIGWTHRFSDKFTTSADVGYHIIHNKDEIQGSTWDNDYFYDFSLTYGDIGDPDVVRVAVQRALSPQSSGEQATSTSISVKETHRFTPRLFASLEASYRTKAYDVETEGDQKDFLEASAALQYNVTRELIVGTNYRFRHETKIGGDAPATGHTVMFTLTYNPDWQILGW